MSTETSAALLVNISTEKWPPRHSTYFGSPEVRSPEPGEPFAITPIRGCTGVMDLGDKRTMEYLKSPKTSREIQTAVMAAAAYSFANAGQGLGRTLSLTEVRDLLRRTGLEPLYELEYPDAKPE